MLCMFQNHTERETFHKDAFPLDGLLIALLDK